MPTYIFRLRADSCVRLSQTPYVSDDGTKSFSLNVPGLVLAAFDDTVSLGGLPVPRGLVIQVQLEAPDFNTGVERAELAATTLLSMLSCVSNASAFRPKPLWGYDATPGLDRREFKAFGYDYNLHLATRAVNLPLLIESLEKIFHKFAVNAALKEDDKERLYRAIQSFRRGMADTEDELDEFVIHWSALETMHPVYAQFFAHDTREHFRVKCSKCKAEITRCPVCEKEDVFKAGQRHTGIEEVFAGLNASDTYKDLRKLRNGLTHGSMALHECVSTAKQNIELVRRSVLSMIMRILGVADDHQAFVLGQSGYKGKYVPHVRIVGFGSFTPGDAAQLASHPDAEVTCKEITASIKGKEIDLSPKVSVRCINGPLTFIGQELWRDPGSPLILNSITVDKTVVIKKSGGDTATTP